MDCCNISIKAENYRKGLIYGEINDMEWFALVHKDQNVNGINPESLRSGQGRVMKLCVFKDSIEEEGDPKKLIFKTSRYIFAEYDKRWEVFNAKYYDIIFDLVNYLEKRYSFRIIKGALWNPHEYP